MQSAEKDIYSCWWLTELSHFFAQILEIVTCEMKNIILKEKIYAITGVVEFCELALELLYIKFPLVPNFIMNR